MDPLISKLKNAEDCDSFEINATRLGRPELAVAARKRGLEYRAKLYGAISDVELECLEAVHAYEQTLLIKNGKRTRAQRTWNMISKHGILGAVEKAVDRRDETAGFTALAGLGLEDYAFESVIVRHKEAFSAQAVRRAEQRLSQRLVEK